jgi:hypothetical protein
MLGSTDEEIQAANDAKSELLEQIKIDILVKDIFEGAEMIVDGWA